VNRRVQDETGSSGDADEKQVGEEKGTHLWLRSPQKVLGIDRIQVYACMVWTNEEEVAVCTLYPWVFSVWELNRGTFWVDILLRPNL
jgi:hypothetical protein